MSDLFHEGLADHDIDRVFAVMAVCAMHDRNYGHTFQILTKRAARLARYMAAGRTEMRERLGVLAGQMMQDGDAWHDKVRFEMPWPLPNVWLGVSVESQQYADERIPPLLASPAAVRFVSYEPALGPVDFLPYLKWTLRTTDDRRLQHPHPEIAGAGGTWERGLDWVIVGGESGHKARPFRIDWARDLLAASREPAAATSRVFVKQLGARPIYFDGSPMASIRDGHGGEPSEWPDDLRVRDFPNVYGEMTQEPMR
jgi:protein gp37